MGAQGCGNAEVNVASRAHPLSAYLRKERFRDEPPHDRLSILESFVQSSEGDDICLCASSISRGVATACFNMLRLVAGTVRPIFSSWLFILISLSCCFPCRAIKIKKGQAMLGPKANFFQQCQYIRGHKKEKASFRLLADYKQTSCPTCDPVPDHK